MNIKRKIFIFSLIVMMSVFSGIALTANAYAKTVKNHVYNLEELYSMDNKDFFKLRVDYQGLSCKNGEELYLHMKQDILNNSDSSDINVIFYNDITKSEKYTAGITEKKIGELFGDELNGNSSSPLYILDYIFSGYDGDISSTIYISCDTSKNDKDILKAVKRFYCVNQVMDMDYLVNENVPAGEQLKLEWGDVNLDNKVDLNDSAYINKCLSGAYEMTRGQKYLCDINNDDNIDILDSISIKKKFASEDEQSDIDNAVKTIVLSKHIPIPGDISGNGNIDIYDVITVAEIIIGKKELNYPEKLIADYNSDFKIDLYDAIEMSETMLS